MHPIISPDFLSEKGMLTAEMLVTWKKERGAYNFKTLPKKAVIGIEANIFSSHINLFSKKIKGIRGVNYIKDSFVFCSGFGSGAPAIITLLEELRVLGVEEFIFIGLAGILSNQIKTGETYIVDRTLSGSGTASYYYEGNMVPAWDNVYISRWSQTLGLKAITCFSTDSPFRETPSLIADVKHKGCSLIEMECAAIYAFSHYYKLKALCLLVAADILSEQWTPPASGIDLTLIQKQLVDRIIKSAM